MASNSFTMDLQLCDDSFLGLDEGDLMQPRQANGDFPCVPFMKLKAGSKAIDRGVEVGIPFTGNAPDLGAFEFGER